jgi:hypothetical protein
MPDEGMADHLRAELALSALDMAIGQRLVMPGALVHHSDQGVQYACGDYIARLERAGIQPSMSRAGCPWDNAMAESFMRTLKREEADGQAYRDQAEAEASITTFIATVYNQQRLHSALAYLAPEDFEARRGIGWEIRPGRRNGASAEPRNRRGCVRDTWPSRVRKRRPQWSLQSTPTARSINVCLILVSHGWGSLQDFFLRSGLGREAADFDFEPVESNRQAQLAGCAQVVETAHPLHPSSSLSSALKSFGLAPLPTGKD